MHSVLHFEHVHRLARVIHSLEETAFVLGILFVARQNRGGQLLGIAHKDSPLWVQDERVQRCQFRALASFINNQTVDLVLELFQDFAGTCRKSCANDAGLAD